MPYRRYARSLPATTIEQLSSTTVKSFFIIHCWPFHPQTRAANVDGTSQKTEGDGKLREGTAKEGRRNRRNRRLRFSDFIQNACLSFSFFCFPFSQTPRAYRRPINPRSLYLYLYEGGKREFEPEFVLQYVNMII